MGTTMITTLNSNILKPQNVSQLSCIKNINMNDLWRDGAVLKENLVDVLKMENLDKIEKMAKFEKGWNGNEAESFSSEAIKLFKNVISCIQKQPQIAPTGRNSIIMQYEAVDKSLLVFELSLEKVEKVYVPKGDYSKMEVELFMDEYIKNINCCLESFYGV